MMQGNPVSERPPQDPPRRPSAPDPEGKVRIMLERGSWSNGTVSCFWHDGCQAGHYSLMVVVSETDDYSVIECSACKKKGRYPVGGSCMVNCDEEKADAVAG